MNRSPEEEAVAEDEAAFEALGADRLWRFQQKSCRPYASSLQNTKARLIEPNMLLDLTANGGRSEALRPKGRGFSGNGTFIHIVPFDPGLRTGACGHAPVSFDVVPKRR